MTISLCNIQNFSNDKRLCLLTFSFNKCLKYKLQKHMCVYTNEESQETRLNKIHIFIPNFHVTDEIIICLTLLHLYTPRAIQINFQLITFGIKDYFTKKTHFSHNLHINNGIIMFWIILKAIKKIIVWFRLSDPA